VGAWVGGGGGGAGGRGEEALAASWRSGGLG
jgi:hypothetical protein